MSGSFFQQSSFATYAIATQRNVVKVAKDLDLAALSPLGCSIQTGAGTVMEVLAPEIGSTLAVFGAGSVGLAAIMAARVMRCATILAVDVHENRLDLARELGATHALNPKHNPELAPEIRQLVGGLDYAVDTTALAGSVQAAVACLRPRGSVAMVGVAGPEVEVSVPMMSLFFGQRVQGVVGGDVVPRTFIPKLIELWRQGQFPFEKLIKFYDFANINQAVADTQSGVTLKPILRIGTV